jgi:hypothetical protein
MSVLADCVARACSGRALRIFIGNPTAFASPLRKRVFPRKRAAELNTPILTSRPEARRVLTDLIQFVDETVKVVDHISRGLSMQKFQIFGYEQQLSQHVNDLSRQMTELRRLRDLFRLAERRLGTPSAEECSAYNSTTFASSTGQS